MLFMSKCLIPIISAACCAPKICTALFSKNPRLASTTVTRCACRQCCLLAFMQHLTAVSNGVKAKKCCGSLALHRYVHEVSHHQMLCPCRFVADASQKTSSDIQGLVLHSKLLHKYLPAIDVEIGVEFGGTEEQRILMINIKCLTDSMLIMVVDQRGRIVHASSHLAQLLGYPAKTLAEMHLSAILSPPFGQLHTGWIKVCVDAYGDSDSSTARRCYCIVV